MSDFKIHTFEVKEFTVEENDKDYGFISGLFVPFNTEGNDTVFSKKAFNKYKEQDISGKKIPSLYGHNSTIPPIGEVMQDRLIISEQGLYGTIKLFLKTSGGNDVYVNAKEGMLKSFSVGVKFLDYVEKKDDKSEHSYLFVNEAELTETSIVLNPAFEEAQIQAIFNKKDIKAQVEEALQQADFSNNKAKKATYLLFEHFTITKKDTSACDEQSTSCDEGTKSVEAQEQGATFAMQLEEAVNAIMQKTEFEKQLKQTINNFIKKQL